MDDKKHVINRAGKQLRDELKQRGIQSVQPGDAKTSDSHGFWFPLAKLSTNRWLELWLDEGINVPAFWVGFDSTSSSDLQAIINNRPSDLAPRGYATDADWNGQGKLKSASVRRLKSQIAAGDLIREDYEGKGHFLGAYFVPDSFHLPETADFCEYLLGHKGAGASRYLEGRGCNVLQTKWERDKRARFACLCAHGYACQVCGFDFKETYGELGDGFIHVHHRDPLCEGEREVDPVKDLVPVCANCHAMLHRKNPPISPEELKSIADTARR